VTGDNSTSGTERCEDCDEPITGTPRWYYGDAYHRDCLYAADGAGLECEVCGISIENELNLAPIEYEGETVQACPGCHGAAGGER